MLGLLSFPKVSICTLLFVIRYRRQRILGGREQGVVLWRGVLDSVWGRDASVSVRLSTECRGLALHYRFTTKTTVTHIDIRASIQ